MIRNECDGWHILCVIDTFNEVAGKGTHQEECRDGWIEEGLWRRMKRNDGSAAYNRMLLKMQKVLVVTQLQQDGQSQL